mmetsp:Transcript_30645/g.97671  ORF Transcript_30645/g.97671 Transcript_30645/m.97671 type:complete len:235 (-) Transcript_30645:551-1255(-)
MPCPNDVSEFSSISVATPLHRHDGDVIPLRRHDRDHLGALPHPKYVPEAGAIHPDDHVCVAKVPHLFLEGVVATNVWPHPQAAGAEDAVYHAEALCKVRPESTTSVGLKPIQHQGASLGRTFGPRCRRPRQRQEELADGAARFTREIVDEIEVLRAHGQGGVCKVKEPRVVEIDSPTETLLTKEHPQAVQDEGGVVNQKSHGCILGKSVPKSSDVRQALGDPVAKVQQAATKQW